MKVLDMVDEVVVTSPAILACRGQSDQSVGLA